MGDFNNQDNNQNESQQSQPDNQNNQQQGNPYYQQPQTGNQGGNQPQDQQPQYQQPQNQQPQNQQYQQPQYQYQQNQQYQNDKKKNNGMAIGALVLGIVSIVLFCVPYFTIPASIVGLILGVLSLKNQNGGKGMAIAGIILCSIGLLFGIMMGIGYYALNANGGFMKQFTDEFSNYNNTY